MVFAIGADNLAVGEKAAADGGAVLGGFPVAVEEVGFMGFGYGSRRWSIGWHFEVSAFSFFSSIFFY